MDSETWKVVEEPSSKPAPASGAARECDVVVIGGGPAGTTVAALLARRGRSVTLLEKGSHPRFHIGESLLPMNLPLFEKLGVLDGVRAIGVRKPAADFTGRNRHDHHTFPFANSLGRSPDHAFQVTRSEFDALLFDNCRSAGVLTLQEHAVKNVKPAARGWQEVQAESAPGNTVTWRCRYVVDASGQDSVLARQQGWRQRDRRHSAAAFFAHFRGVPARDGDEAGNISIYWFDHGWVWMIPLRAGVTSVGAVCESAFAKQRRAGGDENQRESGGGAQALLESVLAGCPAAAARLARAERITPVRSAANYSYRSSRQTGPGFALVGDAFTFIDPVFSSGVYIAMSSADALVPSIEHWLEGRRLRYRLATFGYRRRVGRGIRAFKWFIYRFNTPAMVWLFENPRNVLEVERAVVSLLAGDVYDAPAIRARLLVFKALYAAVSMIQRLAPGRISRPLPAPPEPG